MKKLSLLALVLSIVLLTACEGDDPAGGGGTLATITGLEIGATSAGNTIVLVWTTYSGTEDIDGYEVYFKAEEAGNWVPLGVTTTTGYEHVATVAGSYSVRAYEGDNYSTNYATEVSTMPSVVSTQYTIYDNNAPAEYDSGFKFGSTSGETGSAASTGFVQDIYAYDNLFPVLGDLNVAFQSGNYGAFPNGNPTYMYDPEGTYGYCPEYGTGSWFENYNLYVGDEVVFGCMPFTGGYDIYVKIYIDDIFVEPISEHGTGVTLHYEYQTLQNVTVFTDDH